MSDLPPSAPALLDPLPQAAYIHVPFCAHRCGYCDFTLIAGRDDLIGDYLQGLARELNSLADVRPRLTTLFFGGGTPTHPTVEQLKTLFETVHRRFELSTAAEISVEANPLDLSDAKIDLLADMGVNRISLGVQSFSPEALRILERDHQPEMIPEICGRLQRRFQNISFDLIFGVPGQTLADWSETLDRALDLQPTHLSTYGLTFEQGTAFWTRRERGELHGVPDDFEGELYALAIDKLTAAGFEHDEISNFARPGFQCRHNHVYWNGDPYYGFGPGAARYVAGERSTNIRSVLGWLSRIERGESPVADAEKLEPAHRARELIYLGLRRTSGIDRKQFQRRTSYDLDEFAGEAIQEQVARGLLEATPTHVRLTRAGLFLADRVTMEFL